jgi:small subunit ribosomal protein S16
VWLERVRDWLLKKSACVRGGWGIMPALSGSRIGLIPPEQNFQNNQRYSNFMAVAIRLRREGAKDHPYYRIVVADSRTRRDGRFIDMVGTYDPMKPGKNFDVDIAKVDAWIGKGAKASETVASIIRKARKAQPKA